MIKVLFCAKMPHNSYVGGVAVIINKYMDSQPVFEKNGVSVSVADENTKKENNSIISKLIDVKEQANIVKQAVSKTNPSIIHIHSSRHFSLLKDLYIARKLKRISPAKLVLSIHFADVEKILYKNRLVFSLEMKALNNLFDRIIFLSNDTMDNMISAGLDREKARVLYTFHDFDYLPNGTNTSKKKHLLFVGSIDRRKGVLDLLKAIEQINDNNICLHICGEVTDENIREEFELYLEKLKESVLFHGYVSGQEKKRLFEESDVLILPSYGEGMPIVIMEGLAAGLAIISTNVGAIPEIIHNENGVLISPGDIDHLKNAITYLVNNENVLKTIKATNFEAGKKYNKESNIRELSRIYKECL